MCSCFSVPIIHGSEGGCTGVAFRGLHGSDGGCTGVISCLFILCSRNLVRFIGQKYVNNFKVTLRQRIPTFLFIQVIGRECFLTSINRGIPLLIRINE